MVIAYPISIYLFLNAKTKKQKVLCFLANVLISAGLSSTLTRAGCVIALAGWVFMFIVLCLPVLEADAYHLPAHHCSDRALHSHPVRHYLLLRGNGRGQKVLCGAL